jgi:hypothetical protein
LRPRGGGAAALRGGCNAVAEGRRRLPVSNGFFQMRLIGPSGSNVVVEASADFAAWTPVQTNALPPFGLDVSAPLGMDQQQLFRARLAPLGCRRHMEKFQRAVSPCGSSINRAAEFAEGRGLVPE